MRLGLIAVSTNTGLGIQGKNFYDHMHPVATLVVDISELNGAEQHPEWYPDGTFVKGLPRDEQVRDFIDSNKLDVIFITEAAYSFYVYDYARYRGVKTVNQQNYEFNDWVANPTMTSYPDAFISPTTWHYAEMDAYCQSKNLLHAHIPVPVDRSAFPPIRTSQFKRFLHNAGKPAIYDRNGTYSVIEASKHLQSDAKIVIHFQEDQNLIHQRSDSINDYYEYAHDHGDLDKLELITSNFTHPAEVYALGDVMVLPRRYGGNCLPLNEALSRRLPVLMTDISPNNSILPPAWLLSAVYKETFTPRTTIDIYEVSVHELAKRIDEFAAFDEAHVGFHQMLADGYADRLSWQTLKPLYDAFFEQVIARPAGVLASPSPL